MIDLYRTEHQQPFFHFEDANSPVSSPAIEYFQESIGKADELVFIFPYWWGGMPAIMKNFIDWNFSKGFAFEYVNSRPRGLLVGKEVKVITTTGAPELIYRFTGANRRLKKTIEQQIARFCGMKMTAFKSFGGVDTRSKKIQSILDAVAHM